MQNPLPNQCTEKLVIKTDTQTKLPIAFFVRFALDHDWGVVEVPRSEVASDGLAYYCPVHRPPEQVPMTEILK